MKLNKSNSEYNVYRAEVSYGELLAIRNALQVSNDVSPEVDEMIAGMNFYLDRLPKPGEDATKKDGEAPGETDQFQGMELEPPPGEGEPGPEVNEPAAPEPSPEAQPDTGEEELPEPPARK